MLLHPSSQLLASCREGLTYPAPEVMGELVGPSPVSMPPFDHTSMGLPAANCHADHLTLFNYIFEPSACYACRPATGFCILV